MKGRMLHGETDNGQQNNPKKTSKVSLGLMELESWGTTGGDQGQRAPKATWSRSNDDAILRNDQKSTK